MKNKIILASNSPRRAELLTQLGFSFEQRSYNFDETIPANIKSSQVAAYLSLIKSTQIEKLLPNEVIITADTVVLHKEKVLGKPRNNQEAFEYISELSNSTNTVMSGVTIKTHSNTITFDCSTKVSFGSIPDQDIMYYIKNHNPLDKAGAYGIQEWIGMVGVEKIEGSFYNVMGLPTHLLYSKLKELI